MPSANQTKNTADFNKKKDLTLRHRLTADLSDSPDFTYVGLAIYFFKAIFYRASASTIFVASLISP